MPQALEYNFCYIATIWLIFYWTSNHGTPPLYLIGSEYYKRFGVASNFMFSFVLKISGLLSVPFSSSYLDIFLENIEAQIKIEPPCEGLDWKIYY